MSSWKNPLLLVTGIGISNLGSWIYLIALNLSILELTGSAAAVAGLFIIRPIAVLLTNTWAGGVIDRANKRSLMIVIDCIRGLLVLMIPFVESLWLIYLLLLLTNMAGAFFGPSSSVYITKLVPAGDRKRFNSIMGMTASGALLLGPAFAGLLLLYFSTDLCIILNAISFFFCAFFIYLLPDVDGEQGSVHAPVGFRTLKEDWMAVRLFIAGARYFILVYLLFQAATLIGFALDSQEVTFLKRYLELSNKDYGLIVSLAGMGTLAGSFVSAMVAEKISLKVYLAVGMALTSAGYVLFYLSNSFITATMAFLFLGFFMAFASTGYATFFQNQVPVEIMGRFGSVADMFQGLVQIGLTLVLGFFSEMFKVQTAGLYFSFIGVFFAAILLIVIFVPTSIKLFSGSTKELA